MQRAFDLVGTKVIHQGTGKVVGKVFDLLFNREGICRGLILEKRFWLAKSAFIPISQIASVGEDAIMINSLPELNMDCIEGDRLYLYSSRPKLKGTPLFTSTGKHLGMLEDVYFQEELGSIIGYEVSAGFFADLLEGRQLIKKPDKLMMGKDAFVIHEEADRERSL